MNRTPLVHIFILAAFLVNIFGPMPLVQAQSSLVESGLPAPGVRVNLSSEFNPVVLKGIKVDPNNPLRFDFILDKGETPTRGHVPEGAVSPSRLPSNQALKVKATQRSHPNDDQELRSQATKLIKYFLASLTIPEKDLWVNLSPYEKDRIIPQSFGLTEMGRDLLAEDYMLKQITASLIYPEDKIGRKFWKRIYEEAQKKFGTTDIPVNTFNKVWIVPEKAVVYENVKAGTAYVVEAKLKVMLEQDYLALSKNVEQTRGHIPREAGYVSTHTGDYRWSSPSTLPSELGLKMKATQGNPGSDTPNGTGALGSQIVREIVIPELTKEVNENQNFAQLRQVYNSLILASWYKKKIKDSILAQVYEDKNKTKGTEYTQSIIPVLPTRGHVPERQPGDMASAVSPSRLPSELGLSVRAPQGNPDNAIPMPNDVEQIYQRYLQAFKKGVFNYIKEEQDPMTQQVVPRKYFSGGFGFQNLKVDFAQASSLPLDFGNNLVKVGVQLSLLFGDEHTNSQITPSGQQQVDGPNAPGNPSSPGALQRRQETPKRFHFDELWDKGYTLYDGRFLFILRAQKSKSLGTDYQLNVFDKEKKSIGSMAQVHFSVVPNKVARLAYAMSSIRFSPKARDVLKKYDFPVADKKIEWGFSSAMGLFVNEGYRNKGSEGVWNLDKILMASALQIARSQNVGTFQIQVAESDDRKANEKLKAYYIREFHTDVRKVSYDGYVTFQDAFSINLSNYRDNSYVQTQGGKVFLVQNPVDQAMRVETTTYNQGPDVGVPVDVVKYLERLNIALAPRHAGGFINLGSESWKDFLGRIQTAKRPVDAVRGKIIQESVNQSRSSSLVNVLNGLAIELIKCGRIRMLSEIIESFHKERIFLDRSIFLSLVALTYSDPASALKKLDQDYKEELERDRTFEDAYSIEYFRGQLFLMEKIGHLPFSDRDLENYLNTAVDQDYKILSDRENWAKKIAAWILLQRQHQDVRFISLTDLMRKIYINKIGRMYLEKNYFSKHSRGEGYHPDTNHPLRELLGYHVGRSLGANTADTIIVGGDTYSALSLTSHVEDLPQKTIKEAQGAQLVFNVFVRKPDDSSKMINRSRVGPTFISFDHDQAFNNRYRRDIQEYAHLLQDFADRDNASWVFDDFNLRTIWETIRSVQHLDVSGEITKLREEYGHQYAGNELDQYEEFLLETQKTVESDVKFVFKQLTGRDLPEDKAMLTVNIKKISDEIFEEDKYKDIQLIGKKVRGSTGNSVGIFDPDELKVKIMELLDNARDHARPRGGEIGFWVFKKDNKVGFTISNQGRFNFEDIRLKAVSLAILGYLKPLSDGTYQVVKVPNKAYQMYEVDVPRGADLFKKIEGLSLKIDDGRIVEGGKGEALFKINDDLRAAGGSLEIVTGAWTFVTISVPAENPPADAAMGGTPRGGIDLTFARMNLQTRTDPREGIQFQLDPAMLARLQHASGFVPVIISIRPMTDVRIFLGLKEDLQ